MMSQMPQLAACPSCEEPLESGDRFCGACGYDLSAVPAPPDDNPTVAMNGATSRPPAAAASVDWPVAPEVDTSDTPAPVVLPTDIDGRESDGSDSPGVRFDRRAQPQPSSPPAAPPPPSPAAPPLPSPTQPPGPAAQAAAQTAAQTPAQTSAQTSAQASAEPDEYPLAAPLPPEAPPADPRTADLATPAAGTKVCVACRAGQVDRDGYCENCGHAQPRERDHMEQELSAVAAVSDRGLRHHRNEDAFTVSSTALSDGSPAVLAIVCDGVSSATRPDEASLAASRAANESLLAALPLGTHPQQAMHDAILAASDAVNSLADRVTEAHEHQPHVNAPACTLVGAIVTPSLLIVGWVGDSRVYWVPVDRTSPPARLTEDDSWAAQMVAAGLMNEAEAYADQRAHAITGWLGADAYELEPHTASFKPDRPGVVVVCTDGLWNYAEAAEEMAEVVPPDAADRPLHSAQVLVGHALDGGGHDNVTVAVLPFPAPSQGAGSA
ncbi:PP2C family serine/threonine-protein phosphatase [Streptomyces sp. NBC_00878]|uniref:PP2C family serine/threonine-protein phosphatase n=1 Tax=Streptomyces sp. NBC_00878 TaxID=2975854 RepID=UPI0022546CBF|nr:PP2C family serine/threonine-protein phosphatase [Streptomyces sp. NBC_00878]MCX4908623.1 protein phosphatase 2C domain-containing protein [Streptomyces sp. NBC_00878]